MQKTGGGMVFVVKQLQNGKPSVRHFNAEKGHGAFPFTASGEINGMNVAGPSKTAPVSKPEPHPMGTPEGSKGPEGRPASFYSEFPHTSPAGFEGKHSPPRAGERRTIEPPDVLAEPPIKLGQEGESPRSGARGYGVEPIPGRQLPQGL